MKQTKLIMGMPIIVEILDDGVPPAIFKKVFDYFRSIDRQFSPFKGTSEVSDINKKAITPSEYSSLMWEVLALAEKTKQEAKGYFDVWHNGKFDPSGIVKGWAIYNAAKLIEKAGFKNYYIDAGGDVQASGKNSKKSKWRVGIRNPFNPEQIVKVVYIKDQAIATSGTYLRGQHIYNPLSDQLQKEIVSISVICPDILEADRFATAAFAMGDQGIYFIEELPDFEGYMIDKNGKATYTTNFNKYCQT